MSRETLAQLDRIFHPRSIAIVGASNRERNFGHWFLKGFVDVGFENLYPVHPRESKIMGLKVYPSVKQIPGEVDLAILTSSARTIPKIVAECAEKGVTGVVVYSAGFGEMGEEGKRLEEEIVRIARKGGTRIIGPNCVGISSLRFKIALPHSFSLGSGSVAMISHSGSLTTMSRTAAAMGIRYGKVVSCGNECDLNMVDFLEYFGEDPETKIITIYLEGVKDGRKFYELAGRISQTKPIIIWKGGMTDFGAGAAASHTGALAGSSQVWEAVFKQTGVISVKSAEEMLDCVLAFDRLPLPKGRRVVVVSGMGGPSVGTADACIEFGLEVAEISEQSWRRIARLIPSIGTSIKNPIDLGMGVLLNPSFYGEAVKILARDGNVDMLLVIGHAAPGYSKVMIEATRGLKKALVLTTGGVSAIGTTPEDDEALLASGLPLYPDARRAAIALAKLANYADFLKGA